MEQLPHSQTSAGALHSSTAGLQGQSSMYCNIYWSSDMHYGSLQSYKAVTKSITILLEQLIWIPVTPDCHFFAGSAAAVMTDLAAYHPR